MYLLKFHINFRTRKFDTLEANVCEQFFRWRINLFAREAVISHGIRILIAKLCVIVGKEVDVEFEKHFLEYLCERRHCEILIRVWVKLRAVVPSAATSHLVCSSRSYTLMRWTKGANEKTCSRSGVKWRDPWNPSSRIWNRALKRKRS